MKTNRTLGAVGVAMVLLSCLALIGCGGSSPTAATSSSEPSATPVPTLRVIVRASGQQNGSVTTGVQAGTDFKILGTATACYQGNVSVSCDVIPRWRQRQTGGFDANCAPFGSLSSNAVVWNCTEASRSATIEVCAESFDGFDLGCDSWVMAIG